LAKLSSSFSLLSIALFLSSSQSILFKSSSLSGKN
jgi:hypothetical protein